MSQVKISFVANETETAHTKDYEKLFIPVLEAVASHEDMDFHVTILTTDADTIRALNKQYRGMDNVTDVLSFPAAGFTGKLRKYVAAGGTVECIDGVVDLGDIALCIPRAEDQARELGHSTERELMFLVLHAVLHLMGYDHETPVQEEEMTAVQRRLMLLIQEQLDET